RISSRNRPISWVRSAPNAESAPPSCCRPATAKPCSSILTRSRPKSSPGRTPLYCLIRPAGMAPSSGGSQQRLARAAAAACTRAQRSGKYLAVHASELAVQPDFQILRRYRRPLLLRLEHTHRPTLEDHVHRATRLGSSRSLNLRIGISQSNLEFVADLTETPELVAVGMTH